MADDWQIPEIDENAYHYKFVHSPTKGLLLWPCNKDGGPSHQRMCMRQWNDSSHDVHINSNRYLFGEAKGDDNGLRIYHEHTPQVAMNAIDDVVKELKKLHPDTPIVSSYEHRLATKLAQDAQTPGTTAKTAADENLPDHQAYSMLSEHAEHPAHYGHHAWYNFPNTNETFVIWNGHHAELADQFGLNGRLASRSEPIYQGHVKMWNQPDEEMPDLDPIRSAGALFWTPTNRMWGASRVPMHIDEYLRSNWPEYVEPTRNAKTAMAFDPPEGYEQYYRKIHPEEYPEKFYHVAPRANRESILANGLDATGQTWNHGFTDLEHWNPETGAYFKEDDKGDLVGHEWRPEAIYMFSDEDEAKYYRDTQGDNDIWEIDPRYLSEVIADPSSALDWDYGGEWSNQYAAERVPAEGLRLRDDIPLEDERQAKTATGMPDPSGLGGESDWATPQHHEHYDMHQVPDPLHTMRSDAPLCLCGVFVGPHEQTPYCEPAVGTQIVSANQWNENPTNPGWQIPKVPSEWSTLNEEGDICPHCGEQMEAHDYCKKCHRRVRTSAASKQKWVYLNGDVLQHEHWPEAAKYLAMRQGLDTYEQNRLSNMIAAGAYPADSPHDIACGYYGKFGPEVIASNVDRNAVWDAVHNSFNQAA